MSEIELDHITKRYLWVKNTINDAVKKSEIKKDVRLILVTKYVDEIIIRHLINLGHKDFGENRVQDAYRKWRDIKQSSNNIKLHYLGKLQSNKVNKALSLFDSIQSVESFELLKILYEKSLAFKKKYDFYIQINIGNEQQKNGISISNLKNFMEKAKLCDMHISGFMCIPPLGQSSKKYYMLMRELASKYQVNNLSMGMSNDFITAINCGATEIRVGKAIFLPNESKD